MLWPTPLPISSAVPAKIVKPLEILFRMAGSTGGAERGITISDPHDPPRCLVYLGPCPPDLDEVIRAIVPGDYEVSIVMNPATIKPKDAPPKSGTYRTKTKENPYGE